MIVADRRARLLAVNPAWEALFGPLPADRLVTPAAYHAEGEDAPLHHPEPGDRQTFVRRYRAADGREVHVSWTLTRDGELMFGVGRDDTALIAAEEHLRQAQKMEALGQLTGGIAHDFNNLLTIVIGNLEMARRRLGPDGEPRVLRALDQAGEGADRAATLTQRLLAFARRQPLLPRAIDPGRLVRDGAELFRRAAGERVAIAIDAGAAGAIEVDPGQLEHALLNLVVNARDAMPAGGSVTIGIDEAEADPATLRLHGLTPGRFVRLRVTDEGDGMPADVAARAFEPFFTTKPVGRGTGLGLSQVHGFVTQSGGLVTIDSTPGGGTTVDLWLPRSDGTPELVERAAPRGAAAPAGARVMVVEDNDALRELVVTALRDAGYRVVEAHDGRSGLALFSRQSPPPALVLTDLVMPNLTGTELAAEIRRRAPATRILLMTGYADPASLGGADALLLKPFSMARLLERVAGALAA